MLLINNIMGKKQSRKIANETADDAELDGKVGKNHFTYMYIIGRGGFGKVWQVRHRRSQGLYALKEMSKARIIDKKSVMAVNYEVELLSKIKHPLVTN